MSGRIEKQVKKNSGVVRYGVRTDFTKKRFWTYSVWKSSEEMRHFVPLEPHGTAIKKFVKWGDKGAAFIDWKSTNGKIDWNEADLRLKTKGSTADSK
jgi:hypothetical protein